MGNTWYESKVRFHVAVFQCESKGDWLLLKGERGNDPNHTNHTK